MSHELFELFGLLGTGVGLTTLIHRAVQPILLRLVGTAGDEAATADHPTRARSRA